MSTKRIRPASAAAAGATPDPGTTPTPTVTHYQQVADQLSKALDDAFAIMPKLESPHPDTAGWVNAHLNVPDKFVEIAVGAVEQTPELQSIKKLDVDAARDTLQFNAAFSPMRLKVAAFEKAMGFTMNSGKANVAADSLQVYYLLKGLARDPGSAHLIPIAGALKHALGRHGRTKAAAPAAPAALQKGGLA